MIDTHHPAIINDKQLGVFCSANGNKATIAVFTVENPRWEARSWSAQQRQGRRKLRPSLKANLNRGK